MHLNYRNPKLLWLLFIIYYALITTQHLAFTNLVINPLKTGFGTITLSQHMDSLGLIGVAVLLLLLIIQARNSHCWRVTLIYWLLLSISVLLVRQYLLFHPNEYLHYPQYALVVSFALCIFLIYSGTLHFRPPHEVPPGGIIHINGKPHIFVERTPHLMSSWLPSPYKGTYYIMNPAEGLVSIFVTGLLFGSFSQWSLASSEKKLNKAISC
jgi:hypothetical protein